MFEGAFVPGGNRWIRFNSTELDLRSYKEDSVDYHQAAILLIRAGLWKK